MCCFVGRYFFHHGGTGAQSMQGRRIIRRVLFNAAIFGVVYVLDILTSWRFKESFGSTPEFFWSIFENVFYILILTWINHLVFIPTLFDKKKYILYGLSLFTLLIVFAGYWSQDESWSKFITITMFYSYTTGMGMGAFFLRRSLQIKRELKEKEQLQQQIELSYLKAQVNPHFLFNALNSIYALSLTQSTETSNAVMNLSELMRYQLETAKEDHVLVKEELAFIENYLLLEEQRLTPRCSIEFSIDGDPGSMILSPMLLMPFIENAIKHGASGTNEQSNIDVSAYISGGHFQFAVINSIPSTVPTSRREGLGLENVKRRLQLLYPGKHTLGIQIKEASYEVNLTINPSHNHAN